MSLDELIPGRKVEKDPELTATLYAFHKMMEAPNEF